MPKTEARDLAPVAGGHGLPREVIANSQRERLLEAAMQVVAERGYAATTIGDLTGEAGVSRTTFYELFDDKEACFWRPMTRRPTAWWRNQRGVRGGGDLARSVRAALEAMLAALASIPRLRGWAWSGSAPRGRRPSSATEGCKTASPSLTRGATRSRRT